MKKKLSYCADCAYFESIEPGCGYCHKSPPVIVQHLVKEDPEGGIEVSSILDASIFPKTFNVDFCGDFLSAEDVEWPK